jgi:hypothetical protein
VIATGLIDTPAKPSCMSAAASADPSSQGVPTNANGCSGPRATDKWLLASKPVGG